MSQLEAITAAHREAYRWLTVVRDALEDPAVDHQSAHTHALAAVVSAKQATALHQFHVDNDVALAVDPAAREAAVAETAKMRDITTYLEREIRRGVLAVSEAQWDHDQAWREEQWGPAAASNSRDELFAGTSTAAKPLSHEEQLLQVNQLITQSLQQLRQMAEASIMQSELNLEELVSGTKDMAALGDQYAGFHTVLQTTGKFIKFVNAQSKQDRRQIVYAVTFFAVCCVWILWRRILRRPVMLVLWVVLKAVGVAGWAVRKKKVPVAAIVEVLSTTTVEVLSSEPVEVLSSETMDVLSEVEVETVAAAVAATVSSVVSAVSTSALHAVDEL